MSSASPHRSTAQAAPQTIFRFRRDYNSWVADETMEDYALRYTPKSFRRWSAISRRNWPSIIRVSPWTRRCSPA